jgi:hypothetical protein
VPPLGLSRRAVRLLDVALVVWIAAWLLLAGWLYSEVRSLRELSDAAVGAGGALTRTADAVGVLRGIPFVDQEVARVEADIRQAARRTTRAGRRSRDDIQTYAVLVATTVALGPHSRSCSSTSRSASRGVATDGRSSGRSATETRSSGTTSPAGR